MASPLPKGRPDLTPDTPKTCPGCGEVKARADFPTARSRCKRTQADPRGSRCRVCHNARNMAYRHRLKEAEGLPVRVYERTAGRVPPISDARKWEIAAEIVGTLAGWSRRGHLTPQVSLTREVIR